MNKPVRVDIGAVDLAVIVVSPVDDGIGAEVVHQCQTQLAASGQVNRRTRVDRLAVIMIHTGGELTRARKVYSSHVDREYDISNSVFVGVHMRWRSKQRAASLGFGDLLGQNGRRILLLCLI